MVLGNRADAAMGQLQCLGLVGREPHGLADPGIVERLDRLHPGDARIGGNRVIAIDVVHALIELELLDIGFIEAVHLLGSKGGGLGGRIVAEIDELDGIEMGAVAVDRLDHGLAANLDLDRREGASAIGLDAPDAVLLGIEHREGIMEEVLGNGDLRFLQMEDQRLRVLDLDGVGVPQLGRHDGIALVVLLARVDLLQHVALHQAEHGGTGRFIEAVLDVPRGVLGGEGAPVMPVDVGNGEGPGLEVLRCLPFGGERRPRDVVDAGAGQIAIDLPDHVRVVDP